LSNWWENQFWETYFSLWGIPKDVFLAKERNMARLCRVVVFFDDGSKKEFPMGKLVGYDHYNDGRHSITWRDFAAMEGDAMNGLSKADLEETKEGFTTGKRATSTSCPWRPRSSTPATGASSCRPMTLMEQMNADCNRAIARANKAAIVKAADQVAARIATVTPESSWQRPPEVHEPKKDKKVCTCDITKGGCTCGAIEPYKPNW
jgi:hypothetical protein